MADGQTGVQLLGFSRKGSFFKDSQPNQTESAKMDKKTDKHSPPKQKSNSMKRTHEKSPQKSDTKRGKSILSSGRSKVREIFRRFESQQQSGSASSTDSSREKEAEVPGAAAAAGVIKDGGESSVTISAPVSSHSSVVSLDPEDIQQFDSEGRRIISLTLDRNKDRGSKLLNALKISVPKIPPMKKRDSVVSVGAASLKEDEEAGERPCFSPEASHFIPYTSGMEDTVEYHSEDSDSEFCYSGTLNSAYVKPVRTLSSKSSKSESGLPDLGQGQGYPDQGQGQGDFDQGQGDSHQGQEYSNQDQGQQSLVQGQGQEYSPQSPEDKNQGQGQVNLQGFADLGQNLGQSQGQPGRVNGHPIQSEGGKDVTAQGQRSSEGQIQGQVILQPNREMSEQERRERIGGGQTVDLHDEPTSPVYRIVQTPEITQDDVMRTVDFPHNRNTEIPVQDGKADEQNRDGENLPDDSKPEILREKRKISGDMSEESGLKTENETDGKETDDEEEKSMMEVADFDPRDPIRISLSSENTSDTEQEKENTVPNPTKLNVIDYTRPRSYLICELENPKVKPEVEVKPEPTGKPKVKPKLKPKPKVPKKPNLKVKFSELMEKRDMWMVREESAEQREDEDEEAYQRRLATRTRSLEKTMELEEEEEEEVKMTEKEVCHHGDCTAQNSGDALMLCDKCDQKVHAEENGHLRFDVHPKGVLNRNTSTRSLPGLSKSDEEEEDEGGGGEEEEEEEEEEGGGEMLPTDQDVVDGDGDKKNMKLKRKKALKGRRHHTTDDAAADITTPLHGRSQSVPAQMGKGKGAPRNQDEYEQEIQETMSGFNEIIDGYGSEETSNQNDSDSSDVANQNKYANEEAESSPYANEGAGANYANEDWKFGSWVEQNAQIDNVDSASSSKKKERRKAVVKASSSTSKSKNKYTTNQEYCTLKFDILLPPENSTQGSGNDNPDNSGAPSDQTTANIYEVVETVRGVSLQGAIGGALAKRGLSVEDVDVYVESSKTALPLSADSYMLGGNTLYVRAANRDDIPKLSGRSVSSGNLSQKPKATSQKDRKAEQKLVGSQRSNKKLLSSSDEGQTGGAGAGDTSPHGTLTTSDSQKLRGQKGQAKGPFSIFSPFGKSEGKQELLAEELNQYSLNGLPQMPNLLALGQKDYPDELFELESHWSHLIDAEHKELTKKQKDQQEAVWELLVTEVEFIRKLSVILDLFQCCLLNLQNELLLNEIETEKVFGNVRDIYTANAEFWEKYLVKVVRHSRDKRCLLDPSLLKEGFLHFEELFHPYTRYCLEQKACLDYIKQKEKENDLFKTFIVWAEAQKQCKRLKLQDLIISPMQRLTKYKLLLKAVLKKTENNEHRNDLILMIEKVDRFVLQVNAVMHQKAEQERLSVIIDRIEAYDVIDAPNEECMKLAAEYCKFDLTCPVPGCGPQQKRHLLLEGGLKLKDSISKMDVYCFLFTDMILITKPNRKGDKVKVTKPPMRLDKVVVTLLRDTVSFMLVYLNEYNVASAVYTFHGDSAKVWVDHVKRSQDSYRGMRATALDRTETRLMYLDMYDDTYEEDYAIFHMKNPGTPQIQQDGEHLFLPPDHVLPRSSSHDQLRYSGAMNGSHQRLAASASFDNAGGMSERRRPKSMTFGESRRSRSPRPHLNIERNEEDQHAGAENLSPDVVAKSAGLHAEYAFFEGKPPIKSKPQVPPRPDGFPGRHLAEPPEMDETLRSKLNQRRTRTEKRYHTADSIQELRREPDAAIHKRLSWNLGTAVDINIDEQNRGAGGSNSQLGKGKTFSSDSLRSMPSSSGVSSTGSLHLSPDTEISEEYENEVGELVNHVSPASVHRSSSAPASTSDTQVLSMSTSMTESSTDDCTPTITEDTTDTLSQNFAIESGESQPLPPLPATCPPPLPSSDPPELYSGVISNSMSASLIETEAETSDPSLESGYDDAMAKSKSMPDIATVNLVNKEFRDGIASVEVQGVDGQKRKMTHGEILRMKKQLLLNSTLEASDV